MMKNDLFPKFVITSAMLSLVAAICERLGQLHGAFRRDLRLRRINRIRTIQASLQIEGNVLTVEQVTAVLDGKKVLAPARDVQEIRNALAAYDKLDSWNAASIADLLDAHKTLMTGLVDHPGEFRSGSVGIQGGQEILHIAPPAHQVPGLVKALFDYLHSEEMHPLLKSSIFHYEFEFIHPFPDGNGRLGRLWQTLMLREFNPIFAYIPIENMIRKRQSEYYQAFNQANAAANSACFVEFILQAIFDSLNEAEIHQDIHQVAHQVKSLLKCLRNGSELSSSELLSKLKLKDRVNLRKNYLVPALEAGLIEYTVPESPTSRNQKYRLTVRGKFAVGGK